MVRSALQSKNKQGFALPTCSLRRLQALRLPALLALALVAFVLPTGPAHAQELQRISAGANGSSATSSDDDDDHHHSSRGSSHGHHHSHCDDDFHNIFVEITCYALTAPWWGPHVMLHDNLSRRAYFTGAPYCGVPGYLDIEPCISERVKSWGGHFQAEYASDFGDLSRIGGRVLLEHRSRFGIDTQWNYWSEDLGPAGTDRLWTGDANLVFRFAQSERIAMRSGIGVNWLADDLGGETGFNFTYGLEYFPCRPLVFAAEMDLGQLGDSSLFHVRTTAGVVIGHGEAFIGYDYFDVGDAQINGLVAGVGIWF